MAKIRPESPFNDLLLRYSQELHPKDRETIEAELWERYGKELSILILDMSGFTKLTEAHGIVHYLSMVRRMQLTVEPIIRSYRGSLIKFEADNAFAQFGKPGDAIRAAISINLAIESSNLLTPDELDIRISAGIDHGHCLQPHPHDCYGGAVNLASKLGEDYGKPGKIFVTDRAMALVPKSLEISSETFTLEIGGCDFLLHSIDYCSADDTDR